MSNNQFSFGGWEKCNFLSSENTFKTLAFLNKHFSLKCQCVFLLFLKKFFFEFYFTFLYSRSLLVINLFFLIHHQFYTHQCIYVNPNLPIHPTTTTPTLLSPLGVQTFVLYICVSISALQTGSSVPFFYIPNIYINIYLFFSF